MFLQAKPETPELLAFQLDELIELHRPLYSLCNARDHLDITLDVHVVDDLKMTTFGFEAGTYPWVKDQNSSVAGVNGNHAHNCFNAGNIDFQQNTQKVLWKYDSKPRVGDTFSFYGMQIITMSTREKFQFFKFITYVHWKPHL